MQNKLGQKTTIIMALRPENIGLIVTPVELLGFHNRGEFLSISGEAFACFITDSYWLVESPMGVDTMFGGARRAYIPDTWMEPYIPGVKQKELEVDKVEPA